MFLLKGIFQRNDNTKKKACKLFQIRSDVRTPTVAANILAHKVFCDCIERLKVVANFAFRSRMEDELCETSRRQRTTSSDFGNHGDDRITKSLTS